MSRETTTIHVAPQSELASLLDLAKSAPLILEKEGQYFRVQITEVETDLVWEHYNPAQVKQALIQSAGALAGMERTQLLSDIHAQRRQESIGRSE